MLKLNLAPLVDLISASAASTGNTIKFQKSKFIGSGRAATANDLLESIESVERVVVVDLRKFPLLRFIPLDSKSLLLKLIRLGKLSPSGISPARFDTWLADSFSATTVQRIDLKQEAADDIGRAKPPNGA